MDSLGGDIQNVIQDKELMEAFRKITIGLGELFSEIYPSKTIN